MNEETAVKKQQGKARKWTIRAVIILLLLLIGILLLRVFGIITFPWEPQANIISTGDLFPGGEGEEGPLSNMTPEEIKEQMQIAADSSYFSFKINARPVFEDGRSKGNLEIENPNYNVYPMVVQIFLEDSDELIYDSGGLMPNQHIDNGKLLKNLAKGEYNAIAKIHAYDPETKKHQGRHEAELIITVKN